eukprot:646780-Pyramimonas_sp.AAC.1
MCIRDSRRAARGLPRTSCFSTGASTPRSWRCEPFACMRRSWPRMPPAMGARQWRAMHGPKP